MWKRLLHRSGRGTGRRALVEAVEPRRMLTVFTVNFTANDDPVTVSGNGGGLQFGFNAGGINYTWFGNYAPGSSTTFNVAGFTSGTTAPPGFGLASFSGTAIGSDAINVNLGSGGDLFSAVSSVSAAQRFNVDAGNSQDTVFGHAASDTILGGEGVDSLDGGQGNDNVNGGDQADSITGGTGNDTLIGGSGGDTIGGAGGNDNIQGQGGDDSLLGSAGNDTLFGGAGSDYLQGGSDLDTYVTNDDGGLADSVAFEPGEDTWTQRDPNDLDVT